MRLITAEIHSDILQLVQFYNLGRLPSGALRASAWRSQQATFARYVSNREWSAAAGFYEDLLLTREKIKRGRCTTILSRDFALANAVGGVYALKALRAKHRFQGGFRIRGAIPCL